MGFAASLAQAAEPPASPEKSHGMEQRRMTMEDRLGTRFRRADRDGSGILTQAEFDAEFGDLKGRFADIDANRDQQLDEEELRTWRGRKFEQRRVGMEVRREGEPAPAFPPAAKP
jgi:hypothetical protein